MKPPTHFTLCLVFYLLGLGLINAQAVNGTTTGSGTAVENNPYANYFEQWTLKMQELF
jgi:hypothetical protein